MCMSNRKQIEQFRKKTHYHQIRGLLNQCRKVLLYFAQPTKTWGISGLPQTRFPHSSSFFHTINNVAKTVSVGRKEGSSLF